MPIQTINNKYHQVKLSKTTYERIMEIGIIVFAMLTVWSVLMIIAGLGDYDNREYGDNPLKRKKRKMKCNDIAAIRKYRITLAFYRDFLKDFECVNTDIKSIKKGSFIQCNKN